MKKNITLTLLILCVPFSILFAESSKNEFSSKLLPLVGKKVTVTLKDSEIIEGTLWDFKADSITMKIKKSLIYSQSIEYAISDLDFIVDENGTKVSFTNESKPTAIFFSMDDAQNTAGNEASSHALPEINSEEESGIQIIAKKMPHAEEKEEAIETPEQDTFRIKTVNRTRNQKAEAQKPLAEVVKKVESKNSAPKNKASIVAANQSRASKITSSESKTVKQPAKQKSSEISRTKAAAIPAQPKEAEKANENDNLSEPIEPLEASSIDGEEILIWRYQSLVLLGIIAALAILMIIAKTIGIRGATYGKYTLFPSRLIKREGNFGIINQGTVDGVKIDDIIRFYRKNGQKIEYRGQVQVKKVGETESIVRFLKEKKGENLEVGDVGYRDHNMLATVMKKLRSLTSALLNLLGKTIIHTAHNLQIKEQEPNIEFESETKSRVTVVDEDTTTNKVINAESNGNAMEFKS